MNNMPNFYLYFLNIVFLLICLSTILCLDIFYNFFKKIPKQTVYYSLGIFCLALIIRSACIPHMHHVYYDEFYFIDLAKNILKHNVYGATAIGDRYHLLAFSAPIRPAGYPLLVSYIFRLFGDSARSIFQTNAVFGALSVFLIFWITYLLFKDKFHTAFWSAIVFNFFPAHLKYSGSACSDIISIFFILSCIFLGLLYLKEKKLPLIYLFTSIFIFLCYIKPENLLFLPPTIIFFFILTKKGLIKRSEALFLVSCVFLALLPLILQLPDMLRPENINSKGHFVSFGNILNNILPNISYLFDFRFFLVIATIFFILGLVFLFSENRKTWLILAGWYFFFFIVQSSYFDNKFSLLFTYDSDRRFLYPAISFCMIAGYSIAYFLEKIPFKKTFSAIILLALVLNSIFTTRNIIFVTAKREIYKEYLFLKNNADRMPMNIPIVCFNPYYLLYFTNRPTIETEVFLKESNPLPQIILFKGFLCVEAPETAAYIDSIEKFYESKPLQEARIAPMKKIGFYLLSRKIQNK